MYHKEPADKTRVDNSYVRRYDNGKSQHPFLSKHTKGDEPVVVDLHAHEILETTGFTEFLNVKKAYRVISVEAIRSITSSDSAAIAMTRFTQAMPRGSNCRTSTPGQRRDTLEPVC